MVLNQGVMQCVANVIGMSCALISYKIFTKVANSVFNFLLYSSGVLDAEHLGLCRMNVIS